MHSSKQIAGWPTSSWHIFRTTTGFRDAESFRLNWRNGGFELIVISGSLPDSTAIELLRYVREHADWYVPVLVVNEDESVDLAVRTLTAGADDVISRHGHPLLFAARTRALLRRWLEDPRSVQVGNYRIDRTRRTISREGVNVSLTDKEFALADLLLGNPEQVLTRDYLLSAVWASEGDSVTRTVDTHASRVRHKLGLSRTNGLWLRPVYGHGYKLVSQPVRQCA